MIGLNDFARQWQDTRADATAAFLQTGESAWYILGREVQRFEEALSAYWRLPHVAGVASGMDAIEISLRALGCRAGDKVLTTPVSAFATTLAIVRLGAVPMFVDTDQYGLIDLDAAEQALAHDVAIGYFVPVHLFGHALDMGRLADLQQKFNIAIVEDCAQSIGACFNGAPTGTAGRAAATSFYPTKNLGAMGDGGAILTSDAALDRSVRTLRDYGQSGKYRHDAIGYNSRLDELQAALLRRAGLPRLERWTARRRAIASAYLNGIANPVVRVPGAPAGSNSVWHLFPVLVDPERKAAFLQHLRSSGIAAGEHYPIVIPDQEAMRKTEFSIAAGGIENARRFCRSEVSLPVHPYLTDDEVGIVIDAVNRWAG